MKTLKYYLIFLTILVAACDGDDEAPGTNGISQENLLNYAGQNHAAATFESGTNVAAVYFPSEELESKPRKQLSEVQFYLGEVPQTILLSVMNADENGDPDDMLFQTFLTSGLAGNQWNAVTLPDPVTLDEQNDLWIILTYTNSQRGSFMGCDQGPQLPFGAMFISSTEGGWQRFFVDVNWNIQGVLTDL